MNEQEHGTSNSYAHSMVLHRRRQETAEVKLTTQTQRDAAAQQNAKEQ